MPGSSPRGGALVLGEEQLLSLARRGDVLALLPRLRTYAGHIRPTRSCSRCQRRTVEARARQQAVEGVKSVLAGLTEVEKAGLRRLLGAGSVSFFQRGPRGVQRVVL